MPHEAGEGRATARNRRTADDEADAFNAAMDDIAEEEPQKPAVASNGENGEAFAARAAEFHDSAITPELNALEIVPLDGIRDKKVKEISLEVPYPRMTEDTVRKIREIVEEHMGDIPLSVTLVELPPELAQNGELRLKISHHFRVAPGPSLTSALQQVHANPKYQF